MVIESLSEEPIAATLAQFVSELRYEDLPEPIVDSAKTLILDQFACQLIGSTVPWVMPALELVRLGRGAAAESTVVNHGLQVLAAEAAFVNATFGQGCELDESTWGSAGHIAAATVPVALAMGEREGSNGRQFLLSVVAGFEVMYRLMLAIQPHHASRGFHAQSISGPFAGAAVAGKLLNLDRERMVHALAIAGSHACGPLEFDQSGGEVKRIHAGLAARGGVHSALLAQFGLTGPATIIEGKRGFCTLFATSSDPSLIAPGLGEVFNIANVQFKFYPSVGAHHTGIVAVSRLVAEHDIRPDQIARIRVGVAEETLLHGAGIRRPRDVIGAQFSLAFSLSLAVCKRDNGLARYMDPALWSDPEMTGLMDRIEVYLVPEACGDKSHMSAVSIALKDGRLVETIEEYRTGSPHRPAPASQLDAKVRSLASAVLDPQRIDALIAAVRHLEEIDDISELARLLVRENGSRAQR